MGGAPCKVANEKGGCLFNCFCTVACITFISVYSVSVDFITQCYFGPPLPIYLGPPIQGRYKTQNGTEPEVIVAQYGREHRICYENWC